MYQIDDLLELFDNFRDLTGIEREVTLSYRVFGDSGKSRMLRSGGDLTTSRFRNAVAWFAANWPEGAVRPEILSDIDARTVLGAACGKCEASQ